jgi:hypothetical protein
MTTDRRMPAQSRAGGPVRRSSCRCELAVKDRASQLHDAKRVRLANAPIPHENKTEPETRRVVSGFWFLVLFVLGERGLGQAALRSPPAAEWRQRLLLYPHASGEPRNTKARRCLRTP